MVQLVDAANRTTYEALLLAMFRDRKSVFVDRLGWDLRAIDGFERDLFDTADAEYLILADPEGHDHISSLRLLQTDRPHLLDTLFPELCEGEIPRGKDVREISRLFISPRHPASAFADYRAHLATALVEFGLMRGIRAYTAVIEAANLSPLLSRGWKCRPLGLPRPYGGQTLLALRIEVDEQTIELLRRAGNYREHALQCSASDLMAA